MDESLKRIIIDCDGVIAGKAHGGDYSKAPPLQYGIDQVNKLYDMGYEVVLYTARYGDRENGNIHKQYGRGYREWTDWLEKHGVKYHEAFSQFAHLPILFIDDWRQVTVEFLRSKIPEYATVDFDSVPELTLAFWKNKINK